MYRLIHTRLRMSLPRIVPPANLKVDLTPVESSVCDLLDGCANSLHHEKAISTTCRIAGGWVRDKLLGSQSNDIDVALSDIMGLAFAEHLTTYARVKGVKMGSITAIEQNPEQSKHLETATFKIFGLNIDLVNLRSEEYAENSRIPTEVVSIPPFLKVTV
jgi:tRNA nucleotidyltransferase (CCA-adding enzyme)